MNEHSVRPDQARERLDRALTELRAVAGRRLTVREAARRELALPQSDAALPPEPPGPAPSALPRSFIRRLWSGSWFARAP
jgi:hypothetical protein